MFKPKVNQETCIGCGSCAAIAQCTFYMKDNGKADVSNEQGDDQEMIKMACDSCPVQAITLD